MSYDERNESNKGYQRFKATMHIGMGIFYLLIGASVIYIKYFGAMELPTGFAYVLGSLMLLYGGFRIWRGIMDMKQMKRRDIDRDFPSLGNRGRE
ncbi:MAG: hypothetical protein EOP56_01195 [Sphingobacteriales bacterium]|nr:MAG: hypothetical protein EOP56_01195 [Sphingobacteriales bacterium]